MIFRLERCGMKFAHIGDLHIGKRVHDFSMLEDQRYILDQMIKIFEEQKVDGVLIAGDVYDKTVPSAEAVQLFDEFITGLAKAEIPVYMISGNHDSAERLSFGAKLFESSDIYISQVYDGEMKRIVLKDQYGPISVYLLPFLKPAAVRHALQRDDINTYEEGVMAALQECEIDTTQRNVLVAHQFVTGKSEEPVTGGSEVTQKKHGLAVLTMSVRKYLRILTMWHWDTSTDLRKWGERPCVTVGRRLSILFRKQIIKSR